MYREGCCIHSLIYSANQLYPRTQTGCLSFPCSPSCPFQAFAYLLDNQGEPHSLFLALSNCVSYLAYSFCRVYVLHVGVFSYLHLCVCMYMHGCVLCMCVCVGDKSVSGMLSHSPLFKESGSLLNPELAQFSFSR